ncbi:unnamed protein product [Strongylus vulgaris]|uniref:Uncharacterized protein n=1 Tax=Strongylus vulgaris TaxID=40348 RepID=A0A3P7ITX1_STRVU|nr:unnamed protein product [Strongylus vulgaris]
MLEGNEVEKRRGLRIKWSKNQFMKKAFCEDQEMELEGSPIAETSPCAYLEAKNSFCLGALKEATDQLTDPELRAHLFDYCSPCALLRSAETTSFAVQPAHTTSLRTSQFRYEINVPFRDSAEYVCKAKHRSLEWIPRKAKRPRGRPPSRWADLFVAQMDQLNSQLVTSNGSEPRERPPQFNVHRG